MAKSGQISWDAAFPAPIVLLHGKEDLLARRASERIRQVLRMEDPELEVIDIAADDYEPGALLMHASPSLFMEPKLLRVSGLSKMSDAFLEDAMAAAKEPFDATTILLRHDASSTRGKRLVDTVKRDGVVVDCSEVKDFDAKVAFARAEFAEADREATPGALNRLVRLFERSLDELAGAIAQLVSDTAGQVTEESVAKYYRGSEATSAFDVADAAIKGNAGQALVLLRQAIWSGSSPVPIVAAFAARLRTMAKVSAAGGSEAQAAKSLGMPGWMVRNARKDLQRFDEQRLAKCIRIIAETDHAVKGASRAPEYSVERMVRVIAAR